MSFEGQHVERGLTGTTGATRPAEAKMNRIQQHVHRTAKPRPDDLAGCQRGKPKAARPAITVCSEYAPVSSGLGSFLPSLERSPIDRIQYISLCIQICP